MKRDKDMGHGGLERLGTHLPWGWGKAIPILLKSEDRDQGIWKVQCDLGQ